MLLINATTIFNNYYCIVSSIRIEKYVMRNLILLRFLFFIVGTKNEAANYSFNIQIADIQDAFLTSLMKVIQ